MMKYNVFCGIALASFSCLPVVGRSPKCSPPQRPARSRLCRQQSIESMTVASVRSASVPVLLQVRSDLSLTLPTGWHYSTRGTMIAAQPAGMDDALLLAWIGDATFATAPTRLSVIAVERHRLTLDGYLDGAVRDSAGR